MIAGVGKTYRMLQEAAELLENGIDVQIGYIETHGRAGTEALLQGLPVIHRKKIFYKAKELEEMDLEGILLLHPELVIVDELAHTNVEGCRNEKRWQDVSPCRKMCIRDSWRHSTSWGCTARKVPYSPPSSSTPSSSPS